MSTLIAVDHGNYAVKTAGGHQFLSGLTEHLAKPPLAEDLIEYDGSYWTLSDSRIAYKRDKTRDEQFFILTLFAIAKELKTSAKISKINRITLAVGLPPEHWGIGRESFAEYFHRQDAVNFVYNDEPMSVIIEQVLVYPQAYAAVVPQSARLVDIPRMFIIDIGGMTTDVLLLRNGKPDMQFCRSLETGIITMQNNLCGRINAQYDMTIETEHIEGVIRGTDNILPYEVKNAIRTAAKQHAESIVDKLRELRVDLRSNPAIFIGGGSILLREYLETSPLVAKATFIPETDANAIGYQMLAAAQLKRSA
ncbi:MAG: ParM/StbA family protein [Oscillospiraceae bacterium]|jgi:plasmid segregation protein ParM|nr:ParM/StbA family protein [Oscillospiraceae bacterium]